MLLAPARLDLLQRPRSAGEDLGRWVAGLAVDRTLLRRLVNLRNAPVKAAEQRCASIDSPRVSSRRRKHWGWGFEDQQPTPEQVRASARGAGRAPGDRARRGRGAGGARAVRAARRRASQAPPALADDLRRRRPRARLATRWASPTRTSCAAFAGASSTPPDFVARPREEADVERVLEWCSSERVAAIPFGGGTSVVGGVTPDVGRRLQRRGLDRPAARSTACSRSTTSRARRASRPARRARRSRRQLGEHGLTLRHFPQSFEYSTLGGWIATRAGGHFATLWTHIEDFVESVRAITPAGRVGVAAAARLGRRRRAPTGCSPARRGRSA